MKITTAKVRFTEYIRRAEAGEDVELARYSKMPAPMSVFDRAANAGCLEQPVTCDHARATKAMPLHHADSFDRLLISQTRVEGLVLVTADRVFANYDVALL